MINKLHYSWQQVEGACLHLARQISLDNWKPDYIVGITRGGAIPAVLLSQYMDVPMKPLHVSLRDNKDTVSDCSMAEDAFEGKKILIVDDINDQGNTIAWIKKDWQASALPGHPNWQNIWGDSVRFAVITDNMSSNETVDYLVYEIDKSENDIWIVYPWEDYWLCQS
jgi:hypoxanthine phosphoribosyltransferase